MCKWYYNMCKQMLLLAIDLIVYSDRMCPWRVWLCYETKNGLVEMQFPC